MIKETNLRQLLTSTLLAGLVLTSGVIVQAQDAKKAEPVRKATMTLTGDVTLIGFEDGIKWLGVSATDVPEILKAHLPELKDQGILIKLVVKDSPAEKSGILANDILLALDGTKVKAMADLVTAVQNSKSPKATAEILRGGKRLRITVQLAKRSRYLKSDLLIPLTGEETLRFFGPGQVVPHTRIIKAEKLPENLSILIYRKGNAPATVTVEMDGKKWVNTEDKLNDLPDEIRKHIEKNLKKSGGLFPLTKEFSDSFVHPDGVKMHSVEDGIRIISANGNLTADTLEFILNQAAIAKDIKQIKEHRILLTEELLAHQTDKNVRSTQLHSDQQFQQLKKLIEQLQKEMTELKKQTRVSQKQQPRAAKVLEPAESAN
ncbi:MAG: hypothetical protein COA78_15245 [Blastopirellula sp.]|nr:MAG: hypothetical protein COA78_15245 [Blastopirellula sp.]